MFRVTLQHPSAYTSLEGESHSATITDRLPPTPYHPLLRHNYLDTTMASSNFEWEKKNYCEHRGENRTKAWVFAIAPLFLHLLLVVAISTFMLFYVNGGEFNLTSRRPFITQTDGSITQLNYSAPLQSDITTTLSLLLVLLRTAATAWCGATAWRCAFLLMEKTGISLQEINRMIKFGMPAIFKPHRLEDGGDRIVVLVAIVLLASLPSQFSSPILTGSITWSPSSHGVQGNWPVAGISASADGRPWGWWETFSSQRSELVVKAAGIASSSWGGTNETAAMKRVLPTTRYLPINSTLNNVTVPYFTVRALEWIADPMHTLSPEQIHSVEQTNPLLSISSSSNPLQIVAPTVALIPDKPWAPMRNGSSFYSPAPSVISETRLLVALYSRQDISIPCGRNTSTFFGELPLDVGFYEENFSAFETNCYVYARVTYDAGVAVCSPCRISAHTVVQNITPLSLGPDTMTAEALAMMPELTAMMALMNVSVPQSFNNINQYTVEVLSRSYGAAWTALTNLMGLESTVLETNATVSVPVSQARILHWRLYVWWILNISVTFSGLLFIAVQVYCKKPLVVDTLMAALLLDTSDVLHEDLQGLCNLSVLTKEDSAIGLLRLWRRNDGHVVIGVEDDRIRRQQQNF